MLEEIVEVKCSDASEIAAEIALDETEYFPCDTKGVATKELLVPASPPPHSVRAGLLRASAGRRLAAGLIDRLLPLPFLAAVFWPWALVVIAYDLGRDAQGASVGKRLLGLRTVTVSPDPSLDGQPCSAGRSLLRNLLWGGARVCYLSVVLVPVGIALDVTGCLMVLLTSDGRHLGDRIGGTRVVAAADGKGGNL